MEAGIIGRPVIFEPADIPGGTLTLQLHLSETDDSELALTLNGADSPYTHESLAEALQNQVDPDKLEITVSADNRLRITVARRHVDAGVFVHIVAGDSDADVIAALGLDTAGGSDHLLIAQSVGATFPLTVTDDEGVGILLEFESGGTQDFVWNVPAGSSFATAQAFVTAHGTDVPGATVTALGNELVFELEFDAGETIANVIFDAKVFSDLEVVKAKWGLEEALWGLDTVLVTEGVVAHNKRNRLKYSSRLIAGQAIAAYMLNELTRPEGGQDAIPNTDIIAANETALDQIFGDALLEYHSVVAAFLDVSGKAWMASGGSIDIGIDNGGYLYTYQTHSDLQINLGGGSSHETGHNIGFPDLYDNGGGNYDSMLNYPSDWDIMDNSNSQHPGAWPKVIDSDWVLNDSGVIDVFPEPEMPGPETRHYLLTPLEYSASDYDSNLAAVPDGRTVAKVVRLPLGTGDAGDDHFILIENRQPGPTFSQNLPVSPLKSDPGGIYITDCISRKVFDYFEITTRNYVHPLTDKDLLSGINALPLVELSPDDTLNFEAAYPAYAGISIEVVDDFVGPDGVVSYLVDITREQDDYLDLRIAPWGAPPYESPDIWIEHGDKDPLSDEPLEGNGDPTRWSGDYDPQANDGEPLNWIRVRVTNNGTIEARDVQVRLQMNQPGGIGDTGTWEELPLSDPEDIPAGGEAIFSFAWNPMVGEHTCLKAEVFRWEADLGDLTPSNNGAQENVVDFQPTSSSPWTPTPFQVEVFNPFDHSLDVHVVAERVPYGMKVGIDEQFFTLGARTSIVRKAELRIDDSIYLTPAPNGSGGLTFLYNDPIVGTFVQKPRFEGQFHVVGYVTPDGDYDVPIGGVTYNVFPTTTTSLSAAATFGGCDAMVVVGNSTPAAGNQHLELEVKYPSGRTEWIDFMTAANGTFQVAFPPKEGGNLQYSVVYPPGGLFAATRTPPQMIFNPWLTAAALVSPQASGSVTGTGCYGSGAKTNLTAKPNPGFMFSHWKNKWTGAFESTNNPLAITVSTNLSYIATFVPDPGDLRPDLTIASFTAPGQAAVGDDISGLTSLRVGNVGSSNATSAFLVALYLSEDDTITSTDRSLLPQSYSISSLSTGAAVALPRSMAIVLPDVPAGRYFLGAQVDTGNSVPELNERNNVAVAPITIERGTTYQDWLAANRYTAGDPDKDDDRDGWPNLVEFYFNQDPTDPNDNDNFTKVFRNGSVIELQFTRLSNPMGVTAAFQVATVLGSKTFWREAIADRDYSVLAVVQDRDEEHVTYRIVPADRGTSFYRFQLRTK